MRLLVRILDAVHWRICAFLLRLAGLARRAESGPIQTIVVLRNCFFGDYVVVVPALRSVREAFPQARVVMLTATSFLPGWRDRPQDNSIFQIEPGLIDEVVRYTPEDLSSATSRARLRDRLSIQGPVASLALVYAADSFISRCKRMALCRLLGLPLPYGLTGAHTLPAQTLLNRYRLGRTDICHQKDAALGSAGELLAAHGIEPFGESSGMRPPGFRPPDRALVIGIAPFSKQPVKQWPLKSFAALMTRLHKEHGASFEVYGAASDATAAAALKASLPPGVEAVSMCGTLTPFELRERVEKVSLVVALDSGPMHVASLVGTPVVAIFSQITLHAFWRPWGPTSVTAAHPVPCAACNTLSGECPKGTRACIEGIDVQMVLDQVRRLLSDLSRGPLGPSLSFSSSPGADSLAQEQPQ